MLLKSKSTSWKLLDMDISFNFLFEGIFYSWENLGAFFIIKWIRGLKINNYQHTSFVVADGKSLKILGCGSKTLNASRACNSETKKKKKKKMFSSIEFFYIYDI